MLIEWLAVIAWIATSFSAVTGAAAWYLIWAFDNNKLIEKFMPEGHRYRNTLLTEARGFTLIFVISISYLITYYNHG